MYLGPLMELAPARPLVLAPRACRYTQFLIYLGADPGPGAGARRGPSQCWRGDLPWAAEPAVWLLVFRTRCPRPSPTAPRCPRRPTTWGPGTWRPATTGGSRRQWWRKLSRSSRKASWRARARRRPPPTTGWPARVSTFSVVGAPPEPLVEGAGATVVAWNPTLAPACPHTRSAQRAAADHEGPAVAPPLSGAEQVDRR